MLFSIVGLSEVLQQIPLVFTNPPPSSVIVPPETAEVDVIEITGFVVSKGKEIVFAISLVVNVSSLP